MAYNRQVEVFREEEYPMMRGKTYLDHAGTTIYAKSLIDKFSKEMVENLYGNPHSASAQRNFRVFTANATAAIKLVAESFRDLALESSTSGSFWYGYHKDAHTSLVGPREHTNGQHHCFANDQEVEDWLLGYRYPPGRREDDETPGILAFPGQSNMTGRRLPLSWSKKLRRSTRISHQNTYSLLDAAGLATTTQLDFSDPDASPDFTVLSFYKIFGFPDLGALIVRRKSAHILTWRKYFGGGTVSSLTVIHEASYHRKDATIHDGLEDGTLPFHSIIALGCAIDVHLDLYGSMTNISKHTMFLTRRLYEGLSSIRHSNGRPVCEIYHDATNTHPYTDAATQGATVAFNILRSDGSYVSYSTVEQLANRKDIYVRAGGLCNPGGIASYLKVAPWHFKRAWSAGHRCSESDNTEIINGKPTGVVRASLGAMSILSDVDTFLAFMLETFVEDIGQTVIITAQPRKKLPDRSQGGVGPVVVKVPGNWPIRELFPINTGLKQNSVEQPLRRYEMYDYGVDRGRPRTSHSTTYRSPVHHLSTGSNDSAIVMSATEVKHWDDIHKRGVHETWPEKRERRYSNENEKAKLKLELWPTEEKGKKPEKTLSKAKSFWGLNKVVKGRTKG
ncbi:MOSC N-terminal beta barrel domain-containing protein [Botrytis cinerea]